MKNLLSIVIILLFCGSPLIGQDKVPSQSFCQYEAPPVLVQPNGSMACGESAKDGPHICIARLKCSTPNGGMRSATAACDALSDGTCPGADMCSRDSALSGVKHAQVAKDDAVTEFWGKREEANQRRRDAKLSETKLSSTATVNASGSRLTNSAPASGHKPPTTGSIPATTGSNTRGMR